MEQPTNVLRVAQQLVLALAVMNDPLDIAKVEAGCIRDLLATDAVAIFSWDDPAQRLVTMYSTRPAPDLVGVRSGQGAVGQAFQQRRPTLVNDRPSRCDTPAWDIALGLQVVAAVPLLVAGAAVGVLSAGRTDKKPFTPADVDLLATLGALALAPMIELNRLRGRVRELELRMALQQTRAGTGELKKRLEAGHALRQTEPSARVAIPRLSRRESETLPLLAQGYTNREIGATLHLSTGTVRNTVARLLMKLHARDRTQAVVIALAHGLLESPTLHAAQPGS
jgi:DNA-binding CsgD family transcriptional regulator